ncbi:hypothetical protein MIDIC_110075 [Alphaproteobacteria bacterium]
MILTGTYIKEMVEEGKIKISPFNQDQINPNSYNFCLGDSLVAYKNMHLDVKLDNPIKKMKIPEDGLVLKPDKIYLGHSTEVVGSTHYVPTFCGRSSTGRLGALYPYGNWLD